MQIPHQIIALKYLFVKKGPFDRTLNLMINNQITASVNKLHHKFHKSHFVRWRRHI